MQIKINATMFGDFAMETGTEIVHESRWYYLPASIHKILVYGAHIIFHAILSIGDFQRRQQKRGIKTNIYRLGCTRKRSPKSVQEHLII